MNRETILTACQDIISHYGLQQVLMDEIAKTCGVSKKLFTRFLAAKKPCWKLWLSFFFEGERNTFQLGLDSLSTTSEK